MNRTRICSPPLLSVASVVPAALPALLALLAMLSLAPQALLAEQKSPALIDIASGAPEIGKESILLNAQAEFQLPPSLITALHKNVKLVFVSEIQILKHQDYFPDSTIVDLSLPRQLYFHSLARKYIVSDEVTKKKRSFRSLKAALRYLGRYQDIAVVKTSFAYASKASYMRIRVSLRRDKLPLPLRIESYFSLPWSLSSDWKKWPL